MRWRILGVVAGWLLLHGAAVAEPPSGQERQDIVSGIRADYPAMPEELVGIMADVRRSVNEQTGCALVDWLAQPTSGASARSHELLDAAKRVCILPVDDVTPSQAKSLLGNESFVLDIGDGVMTLIGRSQGPLRYTGSLQGDMRRIDGSDYWIARRRLPDTSRAIISEVVIPKDQAPASLEDFKTFRGPQAADFPTSANLQGRIVNREIASTATGDKRQVQAYLPKGWSRDRTWGVVFLTDGAAATFASVVDALIDAGKIPPVVLVSSSATANRMAEYLWGQPGTPSGELFDRHMGFFANELVAYAVSEFSVSVDPRDRTVSGFSNGGSFALWAGIAHPETFGNVIAMSPSPTRPPAPENLPDSKTTRYFLSGGQLEPSYMVAAQRMEVMLNRAGYTTSSFYPVVGHEVGNWTLSFSEAMQRMLQVTP